jgi:hypothetical protein
MLGVAGNQVLGVAGNQVLGVAGNQVLGVAGNQVLGVAGNQVLGVAGFRVFGASHVIPGEDRRSEGRGSRGRALLSGSPSPRFARPGMTGRRARPGMTVRRWITKDDQLPVRAGVPTLPADANQDGRKPGRTQTRTDAFLRLCSTLLLIQVSTGP